MYRMKKSFLYALRGIRFAFRTERNFRIECAIALILIPFLIVLDMEKWERVVVIFLMGWILCAELGNTMVERMTDLLKPKTHPYAKVIKDLMAAVVLVSSVAASVIGVLIFWPYLLKNILANISI